MCRLLHSMNTIIYGAIKFSKHVQANHRRFQTLLAKAARTTLMHGEIVLHTSAVSHVLDHSLHGTCSPERLRALSHHRMMISVAARAHTCGRFVALQTYCDRCKLPSMCQHPGFHEAQCCHHRDQCQHQHKAKARCPRLHAAAAGVAAPAHPGPRLPRGCVRRGLRCPAPRIQRCCCACPRTCLSLQSTRRVLDWNKCADRRCLPRAAKSPAGSEHWHCCCAQERSCCAGAARQCFEMQGGTHSRCLVSMREPIRLCGGCLAVGRAAHALRMPRVQYLLWSAHRCHTLL